MPCLLNSPAASPLPDLKPLLHQTNPIQPDPDAPKLDPQLPVPNDDFGQEEFRMSPTPESDPNKHVGSFPDQFEGAGEASEPCTGVGPDTEKFVEEWAKRRMEEGLPAYNCTLPFLVGAPKMIQCGACRKGVYPEEKISCSVHGCRNAFHLACAKESLGFSLSSSKKKQFKCPQHVCFLCKQKHRLWRCIRCPTAWHDKCAPFPEHVVYFRDRPGEAICWKHDLTDSGLEKNKVPASTIEDIFDVLPLPYIEEEFKIDLNWKDQTDTKSEAEPHPYVHIRRNSYLVKKKRNSIGTDNGCTNCSSTQCSDGCECRVQCISCSKACRCSKECTNRPFQKVKKIRIVKTKLCGWGVVAAEPISKGDFVVEYVGEVINDILCEQRLWDMKDQDATNFYMCEITKDFVIDATFKGNASRFLNHSCTPNCKLEKWQVEGETRVGVFASRSIEVGEPLTYDYRFVQFGPQVPCHCGAPNCRGYLGTTKKIVFARKTKRKDLKVSWGPKKQRTSKQMVGIAIN